MEGSKPGKKGAAPGTSRVNSAESTEKQESAGGKAGAWESSGERIGKADNAAESTGKRENGAENAEERENTAEQDGGRDNPAGKGGYTPASFEKRTAAWMGLAYVLFVRFAMTYGIYTGGKTLNGVFPLLVAPVSVAAAVVTIHRQKVARAPGGLVGTVLIVLLCAAALVFSLVTGLPPLLAAFRP